MVWPCLNGGDQCLDFTAESKSNASDNKGSIQKVDFARDKKELVTKSEVAYHTVSEVV